MCFNQEAQVVQMNVSYLSPITEVTWSWCFTWPFRDACCFPHVQTIPNHALMYDQSLINHLCTISPWSTTCVRSVPDQPLVYQSFQVQALMHYRHLSSNYVQSVLVQALMHYRPLWSTYLRYTSLIMHLCTIFPDQALYVNIQSLINHLYTNRSLSEHLCSFTSWSNTYVRPSLFKDLGAVSSWSSTFMLCNVHRSYFCTFIIFHSYSLWSLALGMRTFRAKDTNISKREDLLL